MLVLLWLLQLSLVIAAQPDYYKTNDNIYELNSGNFDKFVKNSNYTTIVKFYAPWCGYCKQLKPVYEKLGKFINLDAKYAINVAAVNCDKGVNKQLCSEQQVSGFPTLKVFRPPKYDLEKSDAKVSKTASEMYQGERGLKSMVNFLTSRIKNYVKKINFDNIDTWVDKHGDYKLVLISKNTNISPMFKSLAIDFLQVIQFGFIHSKSPTSSCKILDNTIDINQLPTLLLINKKTNDVKTYQGDIDKLSITKWIMASGLNPVEGELSKKGKAHLKYRIGKKKVVHDEL